MKSTLETSGEDVKSTLETSVKVQGFFLEKPPSTFSRLNACETVSEAETSSEKSPRPPGEFSTRFECGFATFPLVSSLVLHLLHSFRV